MWRRRIAGLLTLVCSSASACAPISAPRPPPARLVLRSTLPGDTLLCVEQWPRGLNPEPCIRVDALRWWIRRGLEPTSTQ